MGACNNNKSRKRTYASYLYDNLSQVTLKKRFTVTPIVDSNIAQSVWQSKININIQEEIITTRVEEEESGKYTKMLLAGTTIINPSLLETCMT